jgi:Ca2+-binding EF-hand superfamily protein
MIRIFSLFIISGMLLIALVHPGNSAAPARGESDLQKIVYLSDRGPIVIDLHLRIDGRSFRTAYSEFMARLFEYLDRDRDGVLSKTEVHGAPPPAILSGPNTFFGGRMGGPAKLDADGDGKVTRDELTTFYRNNGLPPFGISSSPRQSGVVFLNAASGRLGNSSGSADALNKRLFELLDANKDGKLSRDELKKAPDILAKLDENEDELITSSELQGQGGGSSDGEYLVALDPAGGMAVTSPRPFQVVSDKPSDDALAQRLLERYGAKGARTLTRKQLGMSEPAFSQLDRDENGVLDARELAQVGQQPGESAFLVRLGKRTDKEPIVEMTRSSKRVNAKATEKGVTLEVDNVQIEFRGPDEMSENVLVNFDARQQYITQFRMADKDNNSYLDKAEAEKSGFFRATFALMDRDGDGMLFEKEMLAYVDQVEKLRKQASRSCLALTVVDQGKGLFEMIDGGGDGRLSVREIRQMVKLIDTLDRDGDKALTLTEVPRRYKGSFDLGSSVSGNTGARAFAVRLVGEIPRPAPPLAKGPLWFRKMDRNRDGDVSPREWLGTEQEFKKIDTDNDGLISLDEAERYDKLKRAKEE